MFWSNKKARDSRPRMIDVESHIRELLFDSQIQDANEISLLLGSKPISEELLEKEEEESDHRVAHVEHLLPLLHSYATLISDGVIQLQKKDPEVENIPETFWKLTSKLLESVSLNILIGTLSQLHNLEMIEIKDAPKS